MKKILTLLLAATLIAFTASCSSITYLANVLLPGPEATNAQPKVDGISSLRIAVDPGHGGIDGGTSGIDTGVSEAELNLAVSKLLADKFKQAGADVMMTRQSADVDYSGDGDTMKLKDMNNRAKLVKAQNPHVLVSIHMNTFSDRSVSGAQVFYQQGSDEGRKLALKIQDQLNSGVDSEKARHVESGDYFMLRETDCPGVIVECGFLSNRDDEKMLQNPDYRKKLVDNIYKGICKYVGLE